MRFIDTGKPHNECVIISQHNNRSAFDINLETQKLIAMIILKKEGLMDL